MVAIPSRVVDEIGKLESVQRRFTKRLVGLRNRYADRFNVLKLKERRLRFDVMFTYQILFGLVYMNCSDMFTFNVLAATHGEFI